MASSTRSTTLQSTRDALIAKVASEDKILASVFGKQDKASQRTRWSAGARKANRIKEIGQTELDMAIEGVEFEPYRPTRLVATREAPMTQAQIEESLVKVRAILADSRTPESVKHAAEIRIKGLLGAAEKRGYQVS